MQKLHFFFYSKLIEGYGGVETWASYFFPHLDKFKEYEVHIYYVYDENDFSPKLYSNWEKGNFRIITHPIKLSNPHKHLFIKNYFSYATQAAKYLKKYSSNEDYFVHIGSIMGGFCDAYLSKVNPFYRKSKKIVWVRSKSVGEVGNSLFGLKMKFAKKLESSIIKNSYLLITNGYDTKDFYYKEYDNTINRIECIPNVIAHNFLDVKINSKKYDELLNVVFAGRLHNTKGFNYFEDVSKTKYEKMNFIAYGDDNNLNNKLTSIKYMGKYDSGDLKEIFKVGDVFVFLNISSMSGGLSHSLLEAMSAGKIIVAWENDVHCQVLNNKNAWLVKEGDTEDLKNTLIKIYQNLFNNEKEIMAKRLQAREDSKKFTPKEHVKKFVSLIK